MVMKLVQFDNSTCFEPKILQTILQRFKPCKSLETGFVDAKYWCDDFYSGGIMDNENRIRNGLG